MAGNIQPLLLTAAQVAELLGMCERKVWQMRELGQLPAPIRIGPQKPGAKRDGRATRWKRSDIEVFCSVSCDMDAYRAAVESQLMEA